MLWRFRREKRLSLKKNPHFYRQLPTRATDFDNSFYRRPLKDFSTLKHRDIVHIVLDKSCRLYIHVEKPHVIGNVWQPHTIYILKGECAFLHSLSYTPTHKSLRFSRSFGFSGQRPSRDFGSTRLLVSTHRACPRLHQRRRPYNHSDHIYGLESSGPRSGQLSEVRSHDSDHKIEA
jgi:hypothetical protein